MDNASNRPLPRSESVGYHIRPIPRGNYGEVSKIIEEATELADAADQQSKVMVLVEMSDLYGAMQAYLEKHHPGCTMNDLARMSEITKRAFDNGHRKARD